MVKTTSIDDIDTQSYCIHAQKLLGQAANVLAKARPLCGDEAVALQLHAKQTIALALDSVRMLFLESCPTR